MTLIVEDGTGKTDANAFVDVAFFKAYCDLRGISYADYSDTQVEQAIVRATDFLTNSYRWQGFKRNERGNSDGEQSLAWPRSWVEDRNGYSVPNDEVPDEIKRATVEIARREAVTPGSMTPDYTPSERIKMEKMGPMAVEYDLSRTDAESVRPVLLVVRDLIGEFLATGSGSRIAGETARV